MAPRHSNAAKAWASSLAAWRLHVCVQHARAASTTLMRNKTGQQIGSCRMLWVASLVLPTSFWSFVAPCTSSVRLLRSSVRVRNLTRLKFRKSVSLFKPLHAFRPPLMQLGRHGSWIIERP